MRSSGLWATRIEPGPHSIFLRKLVNCGASLPKATGLVGNPSSVSYFVGVSPPNALTIMHFCHTATSFDTISDPSWTFLRPKRSLAPSPAIFLITLHTISSDSNVVLKYTRHVSLSLRMFCGLSLTSLPTFHVVSPSTSS